LGDRKAIWPVKTISTNPEFLEDGAEPGLSAENEASYKPA